MSCGKPGPSNATVNYPKRWLRFDETVSMPACEALLKIGVESGAVRWHGCREPREGPCARGKLPAVHPTEAARFSETTWDAVILTTVAGLRRASNCGAA